MDISYDNDESIRRCFKCDEPILNNLNLIHNTSNSTIILWNKYQIFVYENLEFESASKIIVPEFQIQSIITSSNYLMCVDYTGNVHTTSLKFKNPALKRFKYSFYPRESGIIACSLFNEDSAICLKYESDAYFLSVHKITTDFNLEKKIIIVCNDTLPVQITKDKCVLKTYTVPENHIESVKKVFKIEENLKSNYKIILISFDKINVYGCLFHNKMILDEIILVKLHTCPSEISEIDFISTENNFNIVIGLTIGTLIVLNLIETTTPEIIHLNTAIHIFSIYKDTILYTDGLSMWKAENILTKNITFSQFFVKNVKDFIKPGVTVICTTYSNLIYTFSIDDDRSYVKLQTSDEYCSAENLLNNSECLQKILEEVKKNEALAKKQVIERNYIMALSLSNRQDIMNNIIKNKIVVFENYEEAISENTDIILTSNFSEYFCTESFYFLIKITMMTTDQRLYDILSKSLGDLRIHVILVSAGKIAKTTTVEVQDLIKNLTLLIPLQNKYIITTDMKVIVKIITNMPGALDTNQKIWTILYSKETNLNSNYFINFNINTNKTISLKEPKETLDKLILQTAEHQYGSIIEIVDIAKNTTSLKNWDMYVKLPVHYRDAFKKGITENQFNSKKVDYFLQKFTSEEFLNSKCDLSLVIGKEKVKIEIDNDGFSTPSLRISSSNVKITLDIRNFLSDLIYLIVADFEPGKEYIKHSFYITVENLQKATKDYIANPDKENIISLIEQFERKVIGLLPI